MINQQLCYMRWDSQNIVFTVTKSNEEETVRINSTPCFVDHVPKSPCVSFDFTALQIKDDHHIRIKTENRSFVIEKEEFYNRLEDIRPNASSTSQHAIRISNVSEYITAVDYYRYVSLIKHLETVLKHSKMISEEQEFYLEELKNELDNTYNCSFDTITDVVRSSFDKLNSLFASQSLKDDIKKEVERAISTYENGGSFSYYRGVGRVYFPESPGIFRMDHPHEEARWYRLMKTNFHKELDDLHYLDRLAMMQHYDLPTRLLDVTSNPLVALYMSVNKMYNESDKFQQDYGEVIVYFDERTDTKSYDSSSVLIIAALAKLNYQEKTTMLSFIEEVNPVHSNIDLEKWHRLVNFCIHRSADNIDWDYRFSEAEKTMMKESLADLGIEQDASFSKPIDVLNMLVSKKATPKTDHAEDTRTDDSHKELETESIASLYARFIQAYAHLLTTIRRENPAFTNHIDVFMLTKGFHVRVGMTNDRMRVQNGSFIICGLDKDYINRSMCSSRSSNVRRAFIIDKRKVYRQLNALAINDMTMFPDMTHQAKYLKDQRY